jgi:hypothetical protein
MNGKYNEEEMQIGNDKSIARMHLAVNVLVGSRPKKRLGIHAYFSQSITKSSATYTSPFVDNTGNYTSYISEYSFTNFGLRFSFRLGKLAK